MPQSHVRLIPLFCAQCGQPSQADDFEAQTPMIVTCCSDRPLTAYEVWLTYCERHRTWCFSWRLYEGGPFSEDGETAAKARWIGETGEPLVDVLEKLTLQLESEWYGDQGAERE